MPGAFRISPEHRCKPPKLRSAQQAGQRSTMGVSFHDPLGTYGHRTGAMQSHVDRERLCRRNLCQVLRRDLEPMSFALDSDESATLPHARDSRCSRAHEWIKNRCAGGHYPDKLLHQLRRLPGNVLLLRQANRKPKTSRKRTCMLRRPTGSLRSPCHILALVTEVSLVWSPGTFGLVPGDDPTPDPTTCLDCIGA